LPLQMLLMDHIPHAFQNLSSCFVPAEAGRLLAGNELNISTFGTDGQWGEVDNPQDVALYESMAREGDLQLQEASL
jgi:hypothetical protein